jgi:hypothetical protein
MFRIFNNNRYLATLLFLSTIVFSGVMAQAQIDTGEIKADIPFKITVENATLPAGHYTIIPMLSAESTLEMRNFDKKINVLLSAEYVSDTGNVKSPELVFEKIGGKDFLREVRTPDLTYVLVKPSQETKLEKEGQKAQSHKVSCLPMEKHSKEHTTA